MNRTVLIANTSDMPVAAREASIYTGITIAEYFRDMGYAVAIMADSTSRWAEALREMSDAWRKCPVKKDTRPISEAGWHSSTRGRPRDLPRQGPEGRHPLGYRRRIAARRRHLRTGLAGDTLRIVKVFWGLDAQLAYKRHFPAINWLTSYSLYVDSLKDWYTANISAEWNDNRARFLHLLQEEAELEEIVRLVGMDALSPADRLKMEVARSIREDFLHQVAFHEVDTHSTLRKQDLLMKLILMYYDASAEALEQGADINDVVSLGVREKIGRFKYVPEKEIEDTFIRTKPA
jgi:V/A-type H+-transporting ATPase subunit A